MNTPTTETLVQRRQQRCLELVADISSRTQGPRTPPDVVFVDKINGVTRGRFSWRDNQVLVAIRGFLDDPTTPDCAIDAVVSHEMGHWADPDVAIEARRAIMVGPPLLVVTAVLMVIANLPLPPIACIVAGLSAPVMCVVAFFGIAHFSWPGEERADRFAVDHVGVDAVVTMLEHPPKKAVRRPTPTHPSLRRRIRLVRQAGIPT